MGEQMRCNFVPETSFLIPCEQVTSVPQFAPNIESEPVASLCPYLHVWCWRNLQKVL